MKCYTCAVLISAQTVANESQLFKRSRIDVNECIYQMECVYNEKFLLRNKKWKRRKKVFLSIFFPVHQFFMFCYLKVIGHATVLFRSKK